MTSKGGVILEFISNLLPCSKNHCPSKIRSEILPLFQNEEGLKMFYDTMIHQKKIYCVKEFLIISTKITFNRFSK